MHLVPSELIETLKLFPRKHFPYFLLIKNCKFSLTLYHPNSFWIFSEIDRPLDFNENVRTCTVFDVVS